MLNVFTVSADTTVLTPVSKPSAPPVAKYETRQWVRYGAEGKEVKEWVVVWVGADKYNPNIIKVGLKNAVRSRMRPFYIDQDRVLGLCE